MSRNLALLLLRGVDANRPTLSAGELYCATDTGRIYHGTVPSRLVAITAEVDLTAQAAAITATTLFTPVATGMYRIVFYLKVTRAATTSSTIGSLTITYSDGTDSVAQSVVAMGQTQAGAAATSNAGNGTTTILSGEVSIWAVAGTAIKYAIGYTSSGGTAMQYEAHLRATIV